jgi:hypothetical protein
MKPMQVDRNGLEILGRPECLRLMGLATLGHIGLSSGALPTVLPVNFHLDGERILVRTGSGTKLANATSNAVVAFEVDGIDPSDHCEWSVVVTGTARPATRAEDLAWSGRSPLARWTSGGQSSMIAISTEVISGRRVSPLGTGRSDASEQR